MSPKKDLFTRPAGDEGPTRYGQYYFVVYTTYDERIYLHAQEAKVRDGALIFYQGEEEDGEWEVSDEIITAFGPGAWQCCNGASVLDGSEVNWMHHLVPTDEEAE